MTGPHDHGLLAGADRPVVEDLGKVDLLHGERHVGALADVHRHVARPDADGRRARTVGRPHQVHRAGGQDQGGLAVGHHLQRFVLARTLHPLDAVLRRAGRQGRLVTQLGGLDGALLGRAVGPDDQRIARLQGDQDLEQRRRGGIGDGGDGEDRAHGLGDLHDFVFDILGDHAHGAQVLDILLDQLGGDGVLDDLVLPAAQAGLGGGHLRQLDAGAIAGLVKRPA